MLGLAYNIDFENIITLSVPLIKITQCIELIDELTKKFERDKTKIDNKLMQKVLGK